ncbi:MAG TPA: 30S ribosomal protein S20 [bacterium]|jgi:small subunit ribosomal protein S20|nr:30S ribosomal protein S20 [bacterium]HNS34096.1 30S ribosomal protein S20 [bacterium]HNW09101.1 30S ribosomal protein S20 [bacterium]HNZ73599.1 30S ribosomal protein S20 [bacterium]HOH67213.1 30S ribosomal protein S20 [bacterium]
MPIKKSAMKALRQNKKATVKNYKVKANLKELIKKSRKLIEAKDQSTSPESVKQAIKAIDKAVQNKIIKKNTGSRKKSRLMKRLNQLEVK